MAAEIHYPPDHSRAYRITIEGKIDSSWSDWLGGFELALRTEDDGSHVTTLSGELRDQAALRGLLDRLWDLNLVVRSVQQVTPDTNFRKK